MLRIDEFVAPSPEQMPFANVGADTLFDALGRGVVSLASSACGADGSWCDLGAQVVADLGLFASCDELFARHGQTLPAPVRWVAGPVLARWQAA